MHPVGFIIRVWISVPTFVRVTVWFWANALIRRKLSFVPSLVRLGFAVDKVIGRQVYLRVLRFFPVNIILPVVHAHSFITDSI